MNHGRGLSKLVEFAVKRPLLLLLLVSLITIVTLFLAGNLKMRTNWTDILPKSDPIVKSYREVQDRFGDAGGLTVVLEGNYTDISAMASALVPQLQKLTSLDNVQGRLPTEFIRNHGFVLTESKDFDRMLRIYSEPDLAGILRGYNNDLESEYTDNESNLRQDEVDIARSILGLHSALNHLNGALWQEDAVATTETAVDAITLGEPWLISLDRKMLLIQCEPVASILEVDSLLATVAEVRELVDQVSEQFPGVEANLTGIAKIMEDEMNSLGLSTLILSFAAMLLIYLLLAYAFRGLSLPLIALAPLIVGIIWTMGLLYLLFGGLNLFTAMIMIVLLGLGIDFSIHLISRFNEEISNGIDVVPALTNMLGETGKAVVTGALTSSAAFFALLIGESRGVFEFGVAAGGGVILTLIAVYVCLPPLLVLNFRRRGKKVKSNVIPQPVSAALPILGKIAISGYRRPLLFIAVAFILCGTSFWAEQYIEFEYDFLNLEPQGLKSIQLQRVIPDRFGMSDHSAWLVANSVEECRELKDRLEDQSTIGDVISVSDFIPPAGRIDSYRARLVSFRERIESFDQSTQPNLQSSALIEELNRLWDNLDLMSNLAFASGLDRIVKVIDGVTGTNSETGEVDKNATLPSLIALLQTGVNQQRLDLVNAAWHDRMVSNLLSMSNPEGISLDQLPEDIQRSLLPRTGDGFLILIFPRQYLFSREDLDHFTEQTRQISDKIAGTERLITVMFDSILHDGRNAAWLAILIIVLLVLVQFRSPIGLLSLIPLAGGALLMIGMMYLTGEKYNYMNLIAVPIILGIGIDDGIHALHRYLNERGNPEERIHRAFSHVGRAILLTSLTTMIGFGSVAFYSMEGMASFGRTLFLGVGFCFISTILILPAVLRIFTKRKYGDYFV